MSLSVPIAVPWYQRAWFANLHAILEVSYFAAGIVIAIAAILGLKQLQITRQIARRNAEREAVKFAAERCQYFAECAVPASTNCHNEYKNLGLKFLTPAQFKIRDGEIVDYNFNLAALASEIPKIDALLVGYLNALEAFAIPFVARVADDAIGFQETALSFCLSVKLNMPALFFLRQIRSARYESTSRLYDIWNRRLQATSAAESLKPMQELIKSADKEKMRPLGTDGE